MTDYKNFVFYGSWRSSLEGFKEDFGEEYAKEVLWNLMTAATAGDISTGQKSIIGFVQGACLPNIAAAQERYAHAARGGQNGGRPKLLSPFDDETIATYRANGYTAKRIGEILKVGEKTIRRSRGWQDWKSYIEPREIESKTTAAPQRVLDKTDKTATKTQNPDIEKDIEKDKGFWLKKDPSLKKILERCPDYLSYPMLRYDFSFPDKKGWLYENDEDYNKPREQQHLEAAKLGYRLCEDFEN